jgi:two-component system chemotaxis response regulator CheB
VVCVGASTGGPRAVVEVLTALPREYRTPVLLVLHINEPFSGGFVEWLAGQLGRAVRYPSDGEALAATAGQVVMAPPGRHLEVRRNRLYLNDGPERNSCRPSVDVLFESAAAEYGRAAAGCLLTGMGRDGAEGLLAIRNAGGRTIAQDEASCVVYGMPREAALIGAAQLVLPPSRIGPSIVALNQPTGRAEP